jgi:hypothetical protein
MLPTPDFISNFIEHQFPSFYRDEGQNFIAFVKAYYEWLEQSEQISNKTRNVFSIRDIDQTADQFVEEFRKKYLFGVPKEIAGNKRFLQKHILDLYRSKGSYEGLKLLFRLLYNEDITIYIPSNDILKTSDGVWVEKKFFEVDFKPSNYTFDGKLVTGVKSGATAYVESFQRLYSDNRINNIFFISNIKGSFEVNEKIIYDGLDAFDAPTILGSPNTLTVTYTTKDNKIGDILLPTYGSGSGSGLKALVTETKQAGSTSGTIVFNLLDGGSGYTANPIITITAGSNSTGTGATFSGVTLKNTTVFTYSTAVLRYAPYYPVTESFNGNTSVANTTDFITIANNVFANNDRVVYYTADGNTALTGLTNNTSYWVVTANSTGVKLSATRGGANLNISSGVSETGHYLFKDQYVRVNANGDVANTTEFISVANNAFANGDHLKYIVEAGNTAISGLSNNTGYYVVAANTLGFKLATGNSTTYNTTPINLTSGATEYGHLFYASNLYNLPLNSISYGSSLKNANLVTILGDALTNTSITIGTIDTITGINPGIGYDGYVNISIVDPIMAGFNLTDPNKGTILGRNATVTGNVQIGEGLVFNTFIKDSGYGYTTRNEPITLYNSTQANVDQQTTITVNLGAVGSKEGYWLNTRGFLDSNKYIQDSYYYQEYSCEIKSSKSLDKYLSILKDVFHPVGNQPFGKALILAEDNTVEADIANATTIYRILGAALAPVTTPGVDAFRLNISRLI